MDLGMLRGALLSLALVGMLAGGGAVAQERRSPTLEKIRAQGTIYLGYREDALPFSYLDAGGAPTGFSPALCASVVDAVKQRLGLAKLAVVHVPVSSGARQMMLEAGTIDLECGAEINSVQRQRYVAFSVTTFVSEVKALVRKDTGVHALRDLQGKVVLSLTGSRFESYLRAAAARQGLSVNTRLGRDPEAAVQQVLGGQADALVLDDVQLRALLLQRSPDEAAQFKLLDEVIAVEPYALMLRRNDAEFKALVDATLIGLMRRGDFARIYSQWFVDPIPPTGRSLGLPMGDLLRQLIETPNDRGV